MASYTICTTPASVVEMKQLHHVSHLSHTFSFGSQLFFLLLVLLAIPVLYFSPHFRFQELGQKKFSCTLAL